jgi:membrane-associated HD superfamily phosphohydrolase
MADLKRKIDAMEKNIVSQLEKKIGESFKAAAPLQSTPPPPPPTAPRQPDMNAQFLLAKIGELDKRLEEFSHNAIVSAVQMKNIEESKISARREIEDLLKVVREQQKYSEMDRQMHDQLEKAWTRAEELEKKLMDFYSSVLSMETRRREDSSASSDKAAAAIEALAARLAGIEEKLSRFTVLPGEELRRAQEEFFTRAETERKSESRQILADVKENDASFKEVFDRHVRGEIELLRDNLSDEVQTLRREMAASAQEAREFLRTQSAMSAEKTAEFERVAQANKVRADGVEAALEASARRQALALEEFTRRLGAELGNISSDRAAIESLMVVLCSAVDSLESSRDIVRDLLKDVSPAQLEQIMGVSGLLMRRRFETLPSALDTLQIGLLKLREIKLGVEKRFKDTFGNP